MGGTERRPTPSAGWTNEDISGLLDEEWWDKFI